MVNQNPYNMKQPELGQKIQEWRKAKGLTQEQLVERCQINVRTIQRIEAGEVTPRSFTLKTIMEALEVNEEDIRSEAATAKPDIENDPTKLLKFSFIFGIVYLIFAIVESFVEFAIWQDDFSALPALWYTLIKIIVWISFISFTYGYFTLAKIEENNLVRIGSLLLMIGMTVFTGKDFYVYYLNRNAYLEFAVLESVYFGAIYILFAIGILGYQKMYGSIALVAGCVGIITGLAFISVIFAIPGLLSLTIFELLLLVILYSASQKLGRTVKESHHYSISN